MHLYLASQSYRRKKLLEDFFKLHLLKVGIDESPKRGEAPKVYARRMAKEKWLGAAGKRKNPFPLLTADTIVVFQNKILLKPNDRKDAKRMLRAMSGKSHSVISSVAVGRMGEARPKKVFLCESIVKFRKLQDAEIERYLRSGEWKGKAGAYGIQGSASRFVDSLKGSLTNIVGLPLEESLRALDRV